MASKLPQLAFQSESASFRPIDFDLRSALSPEYPWSSVSHAGNTTWFYPLDKSTCTSQDEIHYDCFSSCNESAFDSLIKLATCSDISLLSDTNYWRDPYEVPILDSNNQQTNQSVIIPDLTLLGNSTAYLMANCLAKLRDTTQGCVMPSTVSDNTNNGLIQWNHVNRLDLSDSLCMAIPARLDPDLAGIGVSQ